MKSNVYVHSPALHACPTGYSPLSVTVGLVGVPTGAPACRSFCRASWYAGACGSTALRSSSGVLNSAPSQGVTKISYVNGVSCSIVYWNVARPPTGRSASSKVSLSWYASG